MEGVTVGAGFAGPDEAGLFLAAGDPPYALWARVLYAGEDLQILVGGGTKPHVGAVCLCEPAVSSHPVSGEPVVREGSGSGIGSDFGENPAVVSRVISGEGHKDAAVAVMFAEAVCARFGVNVCCTAGVHVDDATKDDIAKMLENSQKLLSRVLRELCDG